MDFMKPPLVNPEVPNPIHGFHEVPWGPFMDFMNFHWSFIHIIYEVYVFETLLLFMGFMKSHGALHGFYEFPLAGPLFMDFMKSPIFSFKSTMGPPLHGFHELAGPLFMEFLKSPIFMVLLKSCRLLSSGFS